MMALSHTPAVTCVLLIVLLCLSTPGAAADQFKIVKTFSIGSIDCNLTSSGPAKYPNVKVYCSSTRNIHVTPEEGTMDSILQHCRAWQEQEPSTNEITSFELYISSIHLTLSEPRINASTRWAFLTKLQLQRCTIHGLKREFFEGLFLRTNVFFHDCKFKPVACLDLSSAFSSGEFIKLHFVNSTWCSNHDTVIANVKGVNMMFSQDVAQRNAKLVLENINLTENLSISVESDWQRVRLGLIQSGHLVLTGVELLDLHSPEFLRGAQAFSVQLRRCLLPPGASDNLLRNVKHVHDLNLRETDIDNLPLVPPGQHLLKLQVQNCRLERADFSRLKAATMTLTLLSLSQASIKELPKSWSLVANGSILSGLNLVDLSGNQLRGVPHVPNGRPYLDAAHFVVKLGGNPLHCGCELGWLASDEDRIKAVYRNDDPSCATPQRLAGIRVADAFRLHDPCAEGPPKPPAKTGDGTQAFTPNLQQGESGASILAIVVAIVVALIVASVLIVLCLKWRQRSGGRDERDKVKYTPASKEDGRWADSDKTTMLRSDESHGNRLANV